MASAFNFLELRGFAERTEDWCPEHPEFLIIVAQAMRGVRLAERVQEMLRRYGEGLPRGPRKETEFALSVFRAPI